MLERRKINQNSIFQVSEKARVKIITTAFKSAINFIITEQKMMITGLWEHEGIANGAACSDQPATRRRKLLTSHFQKIFSYVGWVTDLCCWREECVLLSAVEVKTVNSCGAAHSRKAYLQSLPDGNHGFPLLLLLSLLLIHSSPPPLRPGPDV